MAALDIDVGKDGEADDEVAAGALTKSNIAKAQTSRRRTPGCKSAAPAIPASAQEVAHDRHLGVVEEHRRMADIGYLDRLGARAALSHRRHRLA